MGCKQLQLNNFFKFAESEEINRTAFRFVKSEEQAPCTSVPQNRAFKIFPPEDFIGDDVLSQLVTAKPSEAGTTALFLYDGHGSTRLLTSDTGSISARFNYDAYGKMCTGNPSVVTPSQTDMLYSGEQFDPNLQMQYLRARYYDQNNGRFNRLDPFSGNNYDPQSLHKYAYTHCNPVMGIDPSGKVSLTNMIVAISVAAWLNVTLLSAVNLGNFYSAASSYQRTDGRLFDAFYITIAAEYGWKLKGGITGGFGASQSLVYIRSQHKWFGFSSLGAFSGSFSRGVSVSLGVGFNIHKPTDFEGVTLSSNFGLTNMHSIVFSEGKGSIPTFVEKAKNWLIAGNSGILSGIAPVGERTLAGKAVGFSLWTSGYFTGGQTTFGVGLFYSPLSIIKLGKKSNTIGYTHSVSQTWRQDTQLSRFFNERLNPHTIHIESSNFINEVLKALNGE